MICLNIRTMTLRDRRKKKKKTLMEVAEATGIDFSNLSKIERGRSGMMSIASAKRLADYYGITMDTLLDSFEEAAGEAVGA